MDITEDDLRAKFCAGVANIASVSLAIGYPTLASVPHSIANGFKNLLAVAAVTEIEFPEAERLKVKTYLVDIVLEIKQFNSIIPKLWVYKCECNTYVAALQTILKNMESDLIGIFSCKRNHINQ